MKSHKWESSGWSRDEVEYTVSSDILTPTHGLKVTEDICVSEIRGGIEMEICLLSACGT